jgi:amidophosphoribosyltransferase
LGLIKDRNLDKELDNVYTKAKAALQDLDAPNYVTSLYDLFTVDEITNKIAEIVTPKDMKSEVKVIYQTVENLHKACPNHLGDWYFTGNFPTRGGNRVVNQSFVNYMEGLAVRAY